MIYPPGTILQRMYLKERLKKLNPGKFIEIGVGQGGVSQLLLKQHWKGVGFDLNTDSLKMTEALTQEYGKSDGYKTFNENWLNTNFNEKCHLIISSMVLEHLNDEDEVCYFKKCESLLMMGGRAALFLPASLAYWGIEDEIAGHYRRYTFDSLQFLMDKIGWDVIHMAGLTYPVSNVLLPLSNFLVKRAESKKLQLNMQERTEKSGNRKVMFKTTFPGALKFFLNELTLYPFHLWQKINSQNNKSLVIYLECRPRILCS